MMGRGAKKQAAREERARRRGICEACPLLQQGKIKTCGRCGCVIALLVSVGRCPDSKW